MLLGNGDMLFIPPGKSEPSRLQGAYLSSEETEQLMGWYEAQRDRRRAALAEAGLRVEAEMTPDEPDILETVRTREAEARAALEGDGDEGGDGRGDRDPLFREAAELCIQNQSGSTSLLQRRLGIGYGRAARVIDQLADAGVLDPKSGPEGARGARGPRGPRPHLRDAGSSHDRSRHADVRARRRRRRQLRGARARRRAAGACSRCSTRRRGRRPWRCGSRRVPSLAGVPVERCRRSSRPNGALLRAGTLVYQLSLCAATRLVTPLGQRTVTVSETSSAARRRG